MAGQPWHLDRRAPQPFYRFVPFFYTRPMSKTVRFPRDSLVGLGRYVPRKLTVFRGIPWVITIVLVGSHGKTMRFHGMPWGPTGIPPNFFTGSHGSSRAASRGIPWPDTTRPTGCSSDGKKEVTSSIVYGIR